MMTYDMYLLVDGPVSLFEILDCASEAAHFVVLQSCEELAFFVKNCLTNGQLLRMPKCGENLQFFSVFGEFLFDISL